MLKNTQINRIATKIIANALGDLNEKVVYVGGSIVSFYIDDPSAEDVRPTKDIDISIEIDSLNELEELRQELIKRGFTQSSEDDIICRFRYDQIKVDVMSTKGVGWAPANPWFAPGHNNLIEIKLDNIVVRCLSLPYFLATKFTAFYGRGIKDPRTSHDFEDIVYLLNYTSDWQDQISRSNDDVKIYLIDCFRNILENAIMQEAIIANLFYEEQSHRFSKIMTQIKLICLESIE